MRSLTRAHSPALVMTTLLNFRGHRLQELQLLQSVRFNDNIKALPLPGSEESNLAGVWCRERVDYSFMKVLAGLFWSKTQVTNLPSYR